MLSPATYAEIDQRLAGVDIMLDRRASAEPVGRQPLHTVYVPADRAHAELPRRWAEQARAALRAHSLGLDPSTLDLSTLKLSTPDPSTPGLSTPDSSTVDPR